MTWGPILSGPLAAAAAAAADSIARELAGLPDVLAEDPTLADGGAGVALFLDAAAGAARPASLELDRFVGAAQAFFSEGATPSLMHGLTGVAWALDELGAAGGDLAEVDRVLSELVGEGVPEAFDVVHGLAGVLAYATRRATRAAGSGLLSACVAALAARATLAGEGGALVWPSSDGGVDLGVAHGAAGVIAALSGALAAGHEPARPLLAGAVTGLLACGAGDELPARVDRHGGATPARTAWCYGDPGVAVALWRAGCAAGDVSWRDRALALARRAAARDPAATGVEDATLCHGAAGLLHLFARLHHATGDGLLADAARRWAARTLAAPPLPGAGLLTGRAGVGLALFSATAGDPPAWDGVLLVD